MAAAVAAQAAITVKMVVPATETGLKPTERTAETDGFRKAKPDDFQMTGHTGNGQNRHNFDLRRQRSYGIIFLKYIQKLIGGKQYEARKDFK